MMPGVKQILVLTRISLLTVEKPLTLAMKIMVLTMRAYYKGECTLDALSVDDICANEDVFNW
jgi:hypothetical protein